MGLDLVANRKISCNWVLVAHKYISADFPTGWCCLESQKVKLIDTALAHLWDNVTFNQPMGSGCSTVVVHMPCDREVVGSNPPGCWAFLSLLYLVSTVSLYWPVFNYHWANWSTIFWEMYLFDYLQVILRKLLLQTKLCWPVFESDTLLKSENDILFLLSLRGMQLVISAYWFIQQWYKVSFFKASKRLLRTDLAYLEHSINKWSFLIKRYQSYYTLL